MRIKNTKTLVSIFLVLVLTVTVPILMIPTVKALATSATVSAIPNPVVIGQSITLMMDINPDPPAGETFYGIEFSITTPSGGTNVMDSLISDTNGQVQITYVPSEYGLYTVWCYFYGDGFEVGGYYDPCNASTTFTVGDYYPPVAIFTYSPPSPVNVGDIIFFDPSESYDPDGAEIWSSFWQMGDGTTYNWTGLHHTSHSYTNAGTYTVSLTVTDNEFTTDTATADITVIEPNQPPVADAGGPYTGTENVPLAFYGMYSYDNDGDIVFYSWDFGDSHSSTAQNPTHTYSQAGTYTVTLLVKDDDGATGADETTATIAPSPNQPPVADAGGPYTGAKDVPISFNGGSSYDDDGEIVSYSWDFGDGDSSSGQNPAHAYSQAGTYTVTLTVTDDDGATDSDTTTATVTADQNQPPVADAGGPYTGTENVPISFNGGSSYDNDGNIVSYSWNFGDGHSSTGQNPTHAYTQDGTYTITLTVTDDDGATDSDTTTATVAPSTNQPPVADTGGPYTGAKDVPISFNGGSSYDDDGDIVFYSWDFGDGDSSSGQNPSHAYNQAGTYTVTLTVTDDDGATDSDTTTATVTDGQNGQNQPPQASFTFSPPSPEVGETVNLDASGSSDPDGTIVEYSWIFGDGTTGTGMTTSHSYSSEDTFTVTLTVTDNGGLEDSATKDVTVVLPGTPDESDPDPDAGNDQTAGVGSPVTFDGSGSSDNVGIVSYEWDFGDGTSGTGMTPIHTYTEPGIYTVTLTVEDAAGNSVTDSCIITVETNKDGEGVREPRSASVVAQVAVVGTVAVAATAAVASLSSLGQAFNSAIGGLPFPDWLKEFLQLYGKDAFETLDRAQLDSMEEVPLITRGELVSIVISAITMTAVFGFVEANGLPHFLSLSVLAVVIPSVLLAVFMENVAEVLAEALSTRICRVYRKVNLWLYGTGLFVISGLLFRLPSGAPTITRYQSGPISSKIKALIVLSKMLILLTLTLPFAGLYMLGFKTLGDAGLLMTLMTVFYYFIPLKPIVGKAVFDYNKVLSLLALVSTGIFFFSFALGLLSYVVYLAVGAVSVVLAVISLFILRASSCEVAEPVATAPVP